MKQCVPQILAIIFLIEVTACPAAVPDYARTFLKTYGTNYVRRDLVISMDLIDTNNTTPKLSSPIPLLRARDLGEMGRVRIGMSMDEVVAHWGKPVCAWAYCARGARLLYQDMCVDFEEGRVRRLGIITIKAPTPQYGGGLSATSGHQAWVSAMGEPAGRSTNGSLFSLWYSTNQIVTVLRFGVQEDELLSFDIRRESSPSPQKKGQ